MKVYKNLGFVSMLLGISSFILIFYFYPTLIGAPLGLVFGLVSYIKFKNKQAKIGIALNSLALLLAGVLLWYFSDLGNSFGP